MKQFLAFACLLIAGFTKAQTKPEAEHFRISHGPYLQDVSETSATFVWTTNRPGTGWVEIIPVDTTSFYHEEHGRTYETMDGIKSIDTVHTVRIKGLQPGTRYRYRVFSQEVLDKTPYEVFYGSMAGTRVFGVTPPSFRTNDYTKKDISFVMVNDIHERSNVLRNLLSGTDWKQTDFVFFNGDMVNTTRSQEQIFTAFMDTAVSVFAGNVPMYYARGNHETRGPFASSFRRYFPGPEGKLYYIFRQGPVCFVVLDGGEDKPDSDIEYSGITAYDEYRTEQAEWLKTALQSKEFTEAPFKVAVMHIPPFRGWHGEEEVYQKFVPLLNKAGINLMLCAHYHRTLLHKADPAGHNFPVLVNSNNSVLRAYTEGKTMHLAIYDDNGKTSITLDVDGH